jgi:CheY-like chemotaxis protein
MLAYAGKGRFIVGPVNLSALVADASALIQGSISKKITLNLHLDSNDPTVESDASQVQQILMNLALNAGEAIGSAPGVISVSTGETRIDAACIQQAMSDWPIEPGRFAFLEVRDTGCGMDESTKSKIFDPFFTTKFHGRGLGLAAVAGIVRAHKGAILLASAPGAGSTFRVLLPAMKPSPSGDDPPPLKHRAADLRGHGTVLVVDDEQLVRQVARQALERCGYEVLLAESGPSAIDLVRAESGRIHLALLDLSMPGMSGEEVLPELRKLKPDLKVIVSSGFSEAETLRFFHGSQVSGFIQKPYNLRQLAAKVNAAMS